MCKRCRLTRRRLMSSSGWFIRMVRKPPAKTGLQGRDVDENPPGLFVWPNERDKPSANCGRLLIGKLKMIKCIHPIVLIVLVAATVRAETVKVDLNPSDGRKDLLTPHWENWAWHEDVSGSQRFGDVT